MNKNLKFILIFITLFIIIYLIILIINNIFIPSYYSVIYACYPAVAEKMGIETLAETFVIFNKTTKEKKIFINYFIPPTEKIIRHENCHVKQNKRKIWFSSSCIFPLQKFFREVECYSSEYLPDYVWKIIY